MSVTLQVAPGATLPQVEPVTANSPGWLLATLLTCTGEPPILVITSACGADVEPTSCVPNSTLAANESAPGLAGDTPVPVSATDCGLPAPLLVTVSEALRAPACAGVNVSDTVHEAPAAELKANPDVLHRYLGV